MPRISVILTTYNRPKRLKQAIESVLNQTFQDFEILLMDDKSDNLEQLQLLEKYKSREKLRLFISDIRDEDRSKTVRYSALINIAFQHAKGEFIAYLCDDDRFTSDRLQRFVDKFDAEPDVHFIGGDQFCMIEENGVEMPMPEPIRKQTRRINRYFCFSCRLP